MTVVGEGTYELGVNSTAVAAGLAKQDAAISGSITRAEAGYRQRLGGALSGVGRGLDDVTRKGGLFGAALGGIGLGVGVAGFQAIEHAVEGVTHFLGESIDAARAEEAEIATLTTSIHENDKAWDGNIQRIEEVIHSRVRLGFSDGEQRESLRSLVSITKDVNKALDVQREAMDLARLRGLDLGTATLILGKVYGGNIGILARYGIQLKAGTTATEALAEIQRRAAGQAETFASTNAGAAQVLAAEWQDLKEQVGTALLPVLKALTDFAIHQLVPGLMATGRTLGDVAAIAGPILSPIFDHLGEVVAILLTLLGARATVALVSFARSMAAAATATTAASVATEEHVAAEETAIAATETASGAVVAHTAALDTTTFAIEATTVATEAEVVAEEAATVATDEHTAAAGRLKIGLAGIAVGALIAVPIIADIQNSLADFSTDLGVGADKAHKLRGELRELGIAGGQADLIIGALNEEAKRQGRTLEDVTAEFLKYTAAGESANDALSDLHTGTKRDEEALGSFDRAMIHTGETFAGTADAAGHTVSAFDELAHATDDASKALYEKLSKALSDTGATLTQSGAFWGAALKSGETVFATSAEELANKLPEAQKAAVERAKAEAKRAPYEIAKSFREGEDAVYQAALALGEQQTRAQDLTNELVQKQAALASKELATNLRSNVPATRAAAQEQANQLRREILALRAQLHPAAVLASKELQEALHSADPQTRRYAEALADSLRKELAAKQPLVQQLADKYGLTLQDALLAASPAVQLIAKEFGLSLPDALYKYKNDASAAADAQAAAMVTALTRRHGEAVQAGLDAGSGYAGGIGANRGATSTAAAGLATKAREGLVFNAYPGGVSVGTSWINGIIASIDGRIYGTGGVAWSVQKVRNLLGGSLPTDGPLQHPETGGASIASAWVDAMVAELVTGARDVQGAIAGYLTPARTLTPAAAAIAVGSAPGVAAAPAAAVAQPVGGTTDARQFVLNVDGEKPVVSTSREIIDQLQRVASFGTVGYSPTGGAR